MQSKKQNLEENCRIRLAVYMAIVMGVSLYAGLHLGGYLQTPEPNLFGGLTEPGEHITAHPFELFPVDMLMVISENHLTF